MGYYSIIQNYISQIIIYSFRCYNSHEKAEYALPQKVLDERRLTLLDSFFSRYPEKITLAMAAQELNMSTRQANRVIQSYYGLSFIDKLVNTRLTHAKILLEESNFTIWQIAENTGFNSLAHFSKLFKKRMGISPGKYRKNHLLARR